MNPNAIYQIPCVETVWSQSGIVGTVILMALVLVIFIALLTIKLWQLFTNIKKDAQHKRHEQFLSSLKRLNKEQVSKLLRDEGILAENTGPEDENAGGKIIRNVENNTHKSPMFSKKKLAIQKLNVAPELKPLLIAYLGSSVFWLLFGTLIGQYLGMKFLWPDLDHIAWLSFGRLRPVHTNAVFWGWASLGMMSLGHFVVTRTCNTRLFSTSLSWAALVLINLSVAIGSLSLMNGINNGGGEYREYTWPVAGLFSLGLGLVLYNFIKTVALRNMREIYVSNWYILGACSWTIILVLIGYLPFYQNGLGETIIQGYYMHQGVGMWFMTFTLGLVYYFLPQTLNKPIYSYSLGVMAFWTQMLFYTLIGTHHFVFSPLPWWLQTVAIVFSAGMLIPVIAGTTNFIMTFKGAWSALKTSYVLPFLLVGVVFYFTGSAQGTMQAFRYSNLVWHFNDFNVAHSHITMYGIITFLLWGGMYYLLPGLTGKRPSELMIGAHFWLAFVGLLFYVWSMMIGGTLKGMSWMANDPFIESVKLMAPYWLWRAIGGSMMFFSHVIFAINFIYMVRKKTEVRFSWKVANGEGCLPTDF